MFSGLVAKVSERPQAVIRGLVARRSEWAAYLGCITRDDVLMLDARNYDGGQRTPDRS